MAKVGRNEPCPCGSGRKFKKCHGVSPDTQLKRAPLMNRPTNSAPLNAEINMMGVPGMQQHILMRWHYRDPNDPRNAGDLGGMLGEYKVVFTLSRPGFSLLPERQFMAGTHLRGDSHLGIAKPALNFLNPEEEFDQLQLECTTSHGRFMFIGKPNEKGLLGQIESEPFAANNYSDAALKAYQALASSLSNMSLYLDVPVNVYQMDVTELRTGSVRISIRAPYKDVVGIVPDYQLSEEQRKYSSLYREALNSSSSNYQFLCFYKIVEGLRERRQRLRTQAAREAKARGEQPSSYPEERFPNDRLKQIEWLNSIFPLPQEWDDMTLDSVFISAAVGRKIGSLINKSAELHTLRNKIAHAVLDSGEPVLSIDDGLDIDEVEKWLPLAKCLSRYMLKDAFSDMFKRT